MKKLLAFSVALCCTSSIAIAENWTHWRGPLGNGVSETAQPPTQWSETQNVKWKVEIPGKGSGSPIIWENKVFVISAVPTGNSGAAAGGASESRGAAGGRGQGAGSRGQGGRAGRGPGGPGGRGGRGGRGGGGPLPNLDFKVFCYDRSNGTLLWEQTATNATPHQATHSTNGFASASPCTDGEHVYVNFGSRGLYCYSMDGELKWSRTDLGKMETRNAFGEGSSPTLVGNKLILPWDHEGASAIYALNKGSGETIWKTPRDEPTCWATPLIVENGGTQQIIMNGQNYARAYDLESGKELWRCGGQTDRPVASAVVHNEMVFIGSGYRGSFLGAFKLDGSGDIAGTNNVAWTVNRDTPDIASPLLSEGRIYFFKGKSGILSCLDAATGKPHYNASRVNGLGTMIYASPIAAGGNVYLTDREGTTVVIKDGPKLEIVATNSLGETIDATPAPVDNELFIRGEKHLFCISN